MKIGVLGSGKGSNFDAICDAAREGRIDAQITVVLSDVADSLILEKARSAGIAARYIAPGAFKTRLETQREEEYVRVLREHGVELVALAGFMRVIKEPLLRAYAGRIVNIHPSLLPAFKGLRAWEQALQFGVKFAGCTVHFVDEGVDTGPIIAQAVVPVRDDDTPETLHARIQAEEHRIYPEAIGMIVRNTYAVAGRKVVRRP
ncbi:MAG TPA: phosphoribosylglycinamide formyltransferase [bacterium]|nr:phosphoribosylglycinamide formyltransferase [bacterium]